jgi:hypothetical protein
MVSCPHCGAENADGSEFCTLCLALFKPRDLSASATLQVADAPAHPDNPQRSGQTYISPGDYRAYAQEVAQQPPQYSPQSTYQASAYGGAVMQRPGAVSSMGLPVVGAHKDKLNIALMLLSYSLLTFFALFMSRFLVGIILMGAAFGDSDAGFSIGMAILFISDALILAVAGYLISAKAGHRGWGWLYGAGCAACTIFIWQPLASLVLMLLLTGEVFIPLFTLVGILFTLFLELPMGALGGWLAEKRNYG